MENPNSPNGMSSERTAIEAQRAKLQQTAQETLGHLQQKGEEARAQLAPKLDAARTSARELQHQAEATVRERPWVALAVAALAGIAIAKLLS
ncbi:MAG: hypothetical protein RBS88_01660 [Spongiibacteraceae bacterium]|jgi:ElaB/YqjD/DUF883 family membrane-anchored ribosome-binding protein|nr:hypothetical protein [Spongiibacteraceae bacterium]